MRININIEIILESFILFLEKYIGLIILYFFIILKYFLSLLGLNYTKFQVSTYDLNYKLLKNISINKHSSNHE